MKRGSALGRGAFGVAEWVCPLGAAWEKAMIFAAAKTCVPLPFGELARDSHPCLVPVTRSVGLFRRYMKRWSALGMDCKPVTKMYAVFSSMEVAWNPCSCFVPVTWQDGYCLGSLVGAMSLGL